MIRPLVDFSRRTCTRMAGGCPGYGSGYNAGTNATRSVATSTERTVHECPAPTSRRKILPLEKEEWTFRDVSVFLLTWFEWVGWWCILCEAFVFVAQSDDTLYHLAYPFRSTTSSLKHHGICRTTWPRQFELDHRFHVFDLPSDTIICQYLVAGHC